MAELKSMIALSMHKAGSSIADRILMNFVAARGYEIDRISQQVPHSPLPEAEIYEGYQSRMKPNGVYYGMARGPYVANMPIIGRLRTIVQLRDPRDCITSAYFSFRESHVPPKDPTKLAEFQKRRAALQELDIDSYATSRAAQYRMRMQILARIIAAHDDVLVLRYEEMVEDTERWLGRIAAFLDQPVTAELRAQLGSKIDFSVAREDSARHKRQVRPGDHLRKLRPESIAAMTAVLKDELDRFGYAA